VTELQVEKKEKEKKEKKLLFYWLVDHFDHSPLCP
jgi:hypothetical protein